MREHSHLKIYDFFIETKGPLFIGSGESYSKKDYVYDSSNKMVRIMDVPKMVTLLLENNLVDAYETFILKKANMQLRDFFQEYGISQQELDGITKYRVSVGEALVPGKPLSEIKCFIKNNKNQAFIPGSSLKGALRTVLLHRMIEEDKSKEKLLRYTGRKEIYAVDEKKYLNTLKMNPKDLQGEVNSIMKSISVSDSELLEMKDMILVRKDDLSTKGKPNTINLIRECISPNRVIHGKLTIDTVMQKTIDKEFIETSIERFSTYYNQHYSPHFSISGQKSITKLGKDEILLGGGSGYFGKNLVYVSQEHKGLRMVSELMQKRFKGHHHEKDETIGISPHMMKYGKVGGILQHYGVCRFMLKEEGQS